MDAHVAVVVSFIAGAGAATGGHLVVRGLSDRWGLPNRRRDLSADMEPYTRQARALLHAAHEREVLAGEAAQWLDQGDQHQGDDSAG